MMDTNHKTDVFLRNSGKQTQCGKVFFPRAVQNLLGQTLRTTAVYCVDFETLMADGMSKKKIGRTQKMHNYIFLLSICLEE